MYVNKYCGLIFLCYHFGLLLPWFGLACFLKNDFVLLLHLNRCSMKWSSQTCSQCQIYILFFFCQLLLIYLKKNNSKVFQRTEIRIQLPTTKADYKSHWEYMKCHQDTMLSLAFRAGSNGAVYPTRNWWGRWPSARYFEQWDGPFIFICLSHAEDAVFSVTNASTGNAGGAAYLRFPSGLAEVGGTGCLLPCFPLAWDQAWPGLFIPSSVICCIGLTSNSKQ